MNKDNLKDTIKGMEKYIQELKELYKTNPELAKKLAKDGLQRSGIINKNGKLAAPYNGQKVNDDDFTRGPGEMNYDDEER